MHKLMRTKLLGACAAVVLSLGLPTSAMATGWIRQLGTARDDYAYAVTTDADRNVYVAGSSVRTGEEDAWLTKLGPGDRVHWKRQLRTSETDRATGVASDAHGNVYVAGWTNGSLGGPLSGITDAWLAKYDGVGNMLWIRQFISLSSDGCAASDVTTDRDGNAYVARDKYWETSAQSRGWARKYNPWGNQLGHELSIIANPDIATDADGNLYVEGEDGYNGFWRLAKYSTAGDLVWSRHYEGTDAQYLAADSAGNVYVTGLAGDFTDYDVWLAKWDTAGNGRWRRQLGSARHDRSGGIATDNFGNLYITGSTEGSLGSSNRGASDVWLAKYGPAGRILWKEQLGTSGSDEATAVATDLDGNIYVAGSTNGSLSGANRGGWDAFVAKFAAR